MLTLSEAIAQLHRLMQEGTIVQVDNELYGLASDGELVLIEGDMSRPTAARDVTRYIAANPTPDRW